MKVLNLRTEYKINPLGIAVQHPRLSWQLDSKQENTIQSAYRLCVAQTIADLKSENFLWDTGKVASDQSVHVQYRGEPLKSSQKVFWNVTVWDNHDNEAISDEVAYWETGLLNNAEWKAEWITSAWEEDANESTPCPYLRKEFGLSKKIKRARVYASALGLYEMYINGKRVGEECFTPGWTNYQERIQYQVFDVTDQMQEEGNAIGAILGDGWYRGFLVWQGKKNLYGDRLAFISQIKITYEDGSEELILTDKSWKAATGPLLKSDIYNGETYDATKELIGWSANGYDEACWDSVEILQHEKNILVASEGSPVAITETIHPVEKIITPKGELVFDLGQNIVGWVRFRLKGKKGQKITLHHAEVLDSDGNFYLENLREAKAEDNYIFKGEGVEEYEPRFTFHGFRYVRFTGYFGEITLDDIEGRVVHSDMEAIGDFECSDPLINRLQKNIQWGLRGNFLDVPTDCPQRDERLGWTGDAQAFAPTACYNMNVAAFFTKWMKDFYIDQKDDGSVPWVVPNVVKDGGGTGWSDGFGATGWADAAVVIPWSVYRAYGDTGILKNQYASMKAWVDYMCHHAGDRYVFDYGFHFGDWLSFAEYYSYKYNAPDYGYAGAYTEKDLIATAYFYYSTQLLSKTAAILGNENDALLYAKKLPKIKAAFQKEFVTQTGRLTSGTQTAYTLALAFGVMPDQMRKTAAKRLADDVQHFGHLTTGFLGTPLLCQALTDNGYPELAYQLLFNKRYPSWLYPVTKDATTIWERWDCIKPDGSFQTAGMNSFNHYAYGAVGQWLYSAVAGINIDEDNPGYKQIIIKPFITRELGFAKASLKTLYGQLLSGWTVNGNNVVIEITIPANTKAKVCLPTTEKDKVTKNGKPLEKGKVEEDRLVIEVGSGTWKFEIVTPNIC